jgi:transcriptional regulator with XRE-family HTH domain
MGRGARRKQERLAEKLLRIRTGLELSQNELIGRLGLTEELTREEISDFERGVREPPLYVLVEYVQAAGICLDVLVDDRLDLPEKLPSRPRHNMKKYKPKSRTGGKK